MSQFLIREITVPTARLRPLLSVETVTNWIDQSPREVIAMMESGQLSIAFNLGSRLIGGMPFYKIWSRCVLCWMLGRPQPLDLEEAVDDILPMSQTLRAATIRRRCNVSQDLISHLIKTAGWRVLQPARRGALGSAVLDRMTVTAWFRSRRVFSSTITAPPMPTIAKSAKL